MLLKLLNLFSFTFEYTYKFFTNSYYYMYIVSFISLLYIKLMKKFFFHLSHF